MEQRPRSFRRRDQILTPKRKNKRAKKKKIKEQTGEEGRSSQELEAKALMQMQTVRACIEVAGIYSGQVDRRAWKVCGRC